MPTHVSLTTFLPTMKTTEATTSHRSGLPLSILGVPFDNVTTAQTIDSITQMIESKKPHYIATANVDFTALALEDDELRRILLEAHMVVCDGMPLVWASRWLGNALVERVAGSDLVPKLITEAEKRGWSIYFLGGQKEVAWRAVQKVHKEHPGLKIAGAMSPPFKPLHEMDHEAICADIRESKPDLLFVSFGCPKQEKWIAMNYLRAGAPVTIGVGATIDFLAGHMKRAPRWMQVIGFEWLFRMLQEPRRLVKRYAKDLFVFAPIILRQWWMTRTTTDTAKATPPAASEHRVPEAPTACVELAMPVRFDAAEVAKIENAWLAGLNGNEEVIIIDASGADFVDSTGLGLLMRLQKRCRQSGKTLVLAKCSKAVRELLSLTRLDTLFTQAPDRDAARLAVLGARRKEPSVTFEKESLVLAA